MSTTLIGLNLESGPRINYDTNSNSTAEDNVFQGAETIRYVHIDNPSNAASYTKLYNQATAVTIGTTVPDCILPCTTAKYILWSFISDTNEGMYFDTGVGTGTVTAGGTAGTSNPSSSVILTIGAA